MENSGNAGDVWLFHDGADRNAIRRIQDDLRPPFSPV